MSLPPTFCEAAASQCGQNNGFVQDMLETQALPKSSRFIFKWMNSPPQLLDVVHSQLVSIIWEPIILPLHQDLWMPSRQDASVKSTTVVAHLHEAHILDCPDMLAEIHNGLPTKRLKSLFDKKIRDRS